MVEVSFWLDNSYGIIRQRSAPGLLWPPELWQDGRWVAGSPCVYDAIAGRYDEDGWFETPSADFLSVADAAEYAAKHGIDLLDDNPEEPHIDHGPAVIAD